MYVIYFTGVFEYGYVRNSFRVWKPKDISLKTPQEAIEFATKFRFKWVAKLYCWFCNLDSKTNYRFRTYSVKEVIVKME